MKISNNFRTNNTGTDPPSMARHGPSASSFTTASLLPAADLPDDTYLLESRNTQFSHGESYESFKETSVPPQPKHSQSPYDDWEPLSDLELELNFDMGIEECEDWGVNDDVEDVAGRACSSPGHIGDTYDLDSTVTVASLPTRHICERKHDNNDGIQNKDRYKTHGENINKAGSDNDSEVDEDAFVREMCLFVADILDDQAKRDSQQEA